MRIRFLLIAAVVGLAFLPTASAATEAERQEACLLPDVAALCDLAIATGFDQVFSGHADVAFFIVADVVAVLLVVLLVFLLRKIRPFPILKLAVKDKVKEVPPGGTAKFVMDLENLRSNEPLEVLIERPESAGPWDTELRVTHALESGFKIPGAQAANGSVPFTSRRRGAHRAVLELLLKAPADAGADETLEYVMSAVPVLRGRVRPRKARKARITALVSRALPDVKIAKVHHDPAKIAPGAPVTTRAVVANAGEAAAQGVNVVFMLNGAEVESKFLSQLASHTEREIEFRWTPQPGENRIRLAVR